MKIGLTLLHYDFSYPDGGPVTWEGVAASARRAEELGFDSVWISDHFFLSLERYGGGEELQGAAEPMATLAGVAAITERVRLGTLVLASSFRHPAIVAKAATTIDLLSGGRLDLGIGAGWYEDEYRAFGYPFGSTGDRFEILEESAEVLNLLFDDELEREGITWEGNRFRLNEAHSRPRPTQSPRPPLWIGGKGGPRLAKLLARRADGWNTCWAWTADAYAEKAKLVDEACEREGRDPSSLRRNLGLYTLVGEDEADLVARFRSLQGWTPGGALDGTLLEEWGRDKLVGTPDTVIERLADFAALGVEEVIVSAGALPFSLYDETMLDVIAEAVIPRAHAL
ncbi:MAG TPA: LLM class flavin-dependent oxidoreductase [Actinomycetota bacterium]|nr:LLM class flavin-dependent oxidoreductase [Actinomycetota bacterium]